MIIVTMYCNSMFLVNMKGIIVILSGRVFVSLLKGFGVDGWGPRNPFAERIEKSVRNIGPPLTGLQLSIYL